MSSDTVPLARKRQRATSRERPAYPRKRAAQACRTCRQRRTKCDNEQPTCTSCRDLGVECCYQTADKSTFDAASLAILQRLDTLEALMQSRRQESPHLQPVYPPIPQAIYRGPAVESPALDRTQASVLYHINIEAIISWPVFRNHGYDQHVNLNRLLLSTRKQLASPSLFAVVSDFEVHESADLLQSFLDTVHVYNPILEVPKVQAYARNVNFNGLKWDAQSCLLLLVYALGTIGIPTRTVASDSNSFRHSERFQQAEAYFFAAQRRMGMLLCSNDVIDAQCFFLAGVYLMASLRPIEAWKMFVQALACCQIFPTPASNDEPCEDELMQLQNSIYWTCFRSELELRLEIGVGKNGIGDLTYPAFFPSPPKTLLSYGETAWYFYLSEIALRRLGNRILNFVYQHDPSLTSTAEIVDVVTNFEQQAESWLKSLPPILKLDGTNEEPEDSNANHTALRFILNGHLLDCYEMMYWPFMVDAIQGSDCHGTESEAFIRKAFHICVRRIDVNESGFYHRHHGTWLMLRSCTRSALVLLSALRAGLGDLLDEGWEGAVAKVMEMLRYWKDESPDVALYFDILGKLMSEEVSTSPGNGA